MQSGAIASRFSAVSSSVSPLLRLDEETLIFTASADKRLAASSNDVRVRVEASKKRLMTVLPLRAGTFLTSREEISVNVSAVSRMPMISAGLRSRMPRRSRLLKGFSGILRIADCGSRIWADDVISFAPAQYLWTQRRWRRVDWPHQADLQRDVLASVSHRLQTRSRNMIRQLPPRRFPFLR